MEGPAKGEDESLAQEGTDTSSAPATDPETAPSAPETDPETDISKTPLLDDLKKKSKETPMAICRICYSNSDRKDKLLSPCKCQGSIAYVHRGCLERWLGSTNTQNCEICKFQYKTVKTRKPLRDWFYDTSVKIDRRNLFGDLVCFICLTPLGMVSFWLCLQGSLFFFKYPEALIEATSLMAVASFLAFAYLTWVFMSIKYHYNVLSRWSNRNWAVRVLGPFYSTEAVPDHHHHHHLTSAIFVEHGEPVATSSSLEFENLSELVEVVVEDSSSSSPTSLELPETSSSAGLIQNSQQPHTVHNATPIA